MTLLSVYLSSAASTTLTSANTLYVASGNPTTTWTYSRVGTALNFGEVVAQGTTGAWATSGSIGNPTGKGFFLDSNVITPNLLAGNWTANVRLNCAQGGDSAPQAGSIVADIYVRAFKYNTSTLTYTPIIVMTLTAQTITGSFTTFTLTGSTGSATAFNSSTERLYLDIWLKVTTNGNASSIQDIRLNRLSTDTSGLTGDDNASIVTPGFGSVGGGVTTVSRSIIESALGTESVIARNPTGTPSSWTWNTTQKRVEASGGTFGLLIYKNAQQAKNMLISAILDYSDHGGLVWRYADQFNFYELAIHDDSASVAPNTMKCYVVINGARAQVGETIAINFTRNTPHIISVSVRDSSIVVSFDDSVQETLVDSSLLVAGFAGLRNNGGSARFYNFRQQIYGDDISALSAYSRVTLRSDDPSADVRVSSLTLSAHAPTIQDGAFIPQTSYSILNGNKKTQADILDDLAKASNYWWKIKSNVLNFRQIEALPAQWCITKKDVLVANVDVDNSNDYYRNGQWITNAIDTIEQIEDFTGNGVDSTFNLGFNVDSITSITLDGRVQTVGVKGVDTGKDWYYEQGSNAIVQDSAALKITDAQTLRVTYNARISISVYVQDDAEIARVAALDGTSGIIELAEDAKGISKSGAISLAVSRLQQYGKKAKTIKFSTRRSGLQVGQLCAVFLDTFGIENGNYLITSIKRDWRPENIGSLRIVPIHSVTATTGPIVGDWTRFINNLAS